MFSKVTRAAAGDDEDMTGQAWDEHETERDSKTLRFLEKFL